MTSRGMKPLSATIPDKLEARLKALAKAEGRSLSNLVSYLLERGIDEHVRIHGPIDTDEANSEVP